MMDRFALVVGGGGWSVCSSWDLTAVVTGVNEDGMIFAFEARIVGVFVWILLLGVKGN